MEFLLVFILVLGVAYLWFVMKKDSDNDQTVSPNPVVEPTPVIEPKPVVEVTELNVPLVTAMEEPVAVKKARKPRTTKGEKIAKATKKTKSSKA